MVIADARPALGDAIREARLARQESLRFAATAVGISPSMLSQIENGRTWPSMKTLAVVAGHLSISIDEVLGLVPRSVFPLPPMVNVPAVMQRSADDPRVEVDGVMWRRLAQSDAGSVAPLVGTFRPGATTSLEGLAPRATGFEHAFVLEGSLTVVLGDEAHVLRAGDSVAVAAEREHVYINHTSAPARLLCYVVGWR